MVTETNIEQANLGRKLGSITIDVYETEGCIQFAAHPQITYSEALQQMVLLLSDKEQQIIGTLKQEMAINACSLFAYVRNPDFFNKDLDK